MENNGMGMKIQKEKTRKKRKNTAYKEPVSAGLIMSALMALSAFLSKFFSESLLVRFFCSYDKAELSLSSSYIATSSTANGLKKQANKIKIGVDRFISSSFLKRGSDSVTSALLRHKTANYGWFLFCIGAYSLVMQPLKWYIGGENLELTSLIAPAVIVLISFLFVFDNRPLADTVCGNRVLSFFAFDLLGAREYYLHPGEEPLSSPGVVLSVGMVLGLVCYFVSPVYILLGVLLLLLASAVLHMPQVGVVLLILVAPFVGEEHILILTLYTDIAYMLKVIRGKRRFDVGVCDMFVIALVLLITLYGFLSPTAEGRKTALITAAMITSYFPAKNLMMTYEWLKRCFMACVTSLLLFSSLCFWDTVETLLSGAGYFGLRGGVPAFIGSPDVAASFILMLCPFVLVRLLQKNKASGNLAYLITFIAAVIALAFTGASDALAPFAVGFVIFMMTYSEGTFAALAVAVPAGVISFVLLPNNIRSEFFVSVLSTDPKTGMFAKIVADYGVLALVLFTVIAICLFSMTGTRLRRSRGMDMYSQYLMFAPSLSVLFILLQSISHNTFNDSRTVILLFLTVGIGGAIYSYSERDEELVLGRMEEQGIIYRRMD